MNYQNPLTVVRIRNIWGGIYGVTYRVGKSKRHFEELFRRIGERWFSGVANPVGTRSSPLREASRQFAAALDAAETAEKEKQEKACTK